LITGIRTWPADVRGLLGRFLPQGALLLSVLTFGSYAMGLVRDRVFARTYGAGPELDAYNAAFVLPELALDVLVASGLTAPFVPVFSTLRRDDAAAAARFAQTVLTLAILVMGTASLALLVLAPWSADVIVPGFDAAGRERYLDLYRLMLLTPVVFAASTALGEVLVAERRFLSYALAPILYNAGIAGGTILLHGSLGIRAAAIGAVAGAFLHLGIRVVGIVRSPVRIRPRLDLRMPAVREFIRLMVPKMVSHPVEPLTFLFFTSVATTLAAGSVTAVSFARNFQSVPVSLIGVAFSVAAFPGLSSVWAARDRTEFRRLVRTNLLTIGSLTLVAAIGLAVVAPIAIEVLLGGGEFGPEDVALTAGVLAAFALSVPFDALSHLLSRSVYATHNTILPVLASVAGFGVTVATTLLLVSPLGVIAIPLGFASGTAVKTGLLGLALARRLATPAGEAGVSGSAASSAPPR
jgi:putative peptidoglycan lipid II flippase